jgi:hypothetical protein
MTIALALGGCTRTPTYLYGQDYSRVHFHISGPNMGVYPDQTVLTEPNNPFANNPPNYNCAPDAGNECKAHWDLQANAGPVVAFYSWATIDALSPGGEYQYYAALDLQQIYQTGQADAADLPTAERLAVAGYQSVLDNFPLSVTYDKDGITSYSLADLSLAAIVAICPAQPTADQPWCKVKNGWVLVGGHAVHP